MPGPTWWTAPPRARSRARSRPPGAWSGARSRATEGLRGLGQGPAAEAHRDARRPASGTGAADRRPDRQPARATSAGAVLVPGVARSSGRRGRAPAASACSGRNVSHITASSSVRVAPERLLDQARLRAVRQAGRVQRDRADVDALARAELAVDVVDDLLGLHVGVVVRAARSPAGPSRASAGRTSRSRSSGPGRSGARAAAGAGARPWARSRRC